MAKNKLKKLTLITSGIAIPIIAASVALPLALVSTNKNKTSFNTKNVAPQEFKFLYENKYYDSTEEIVNQLLNNNKLISQSVYYGDLNKAIFDQVSKRLDIEQLKKYDPSKIKPAYINSFGQYESNFEKAKKSFINQGLIRYFYLDNSGKMHSTEVDAILSNKENIKVDKVAYHTIRDSKGNVHEINPFNKNDVKSLLEIGLKNAIDNNSNGFKLKFFAKEEDIKGKVKYKNDQLSVLLENNDFIDNLSKNLKSYLKQIKNKIFSEYKFNFEVSISGKTGRDYQFWNNEIITNNNNGAHINFIRDKNNKNRITKIDFLDLKLTDIEIINRFIKRESFLNNNNYRWQVRTWNTHKDPFDKLVAEEADATFILSSDNKYKLNLDYFGSNDGWAKGSDIGLLRKRDGGWVSFDIKNLNNDPNEKNIIKNNALFKGILFEGDKLKDDFLNYLISKHANINNEIYNKSNILLNNILKHIFLTNEGQTTNNLSFLDNMIGSFFTDINNSNLNTNEIYITDASNINFESSNANLTINKNKIIDDIINMNNMVLSLTYNDYPIFEFDMSPNEERQINLKKENENDFRLYLINKLINHISSANIKNISNSVLSQNVYSVNDHQIVKIKNHFIEIPSDVFEYVPTLNKNTNSDPKTYQNGLWYAAYSYNDNLNSYMNKNNLNNINISNSQINEKLISDDVLFVLRDVEGKYEKINYANYLGLSNDFNESISKIDKKLIYDDKSLDIAKNRANNIKPSKIVVLYNIAGEIMNPGIKLSDDFVISTSSNALYDSEQNILDNVLRTLIIEKSQNFFYYQNDDGTSTLIKNQTNYVFDLNWENRNYYFATFKDAWNYLHEIIKNRSIKVGI